MPRAQSGHLPFVPLPLHTPSDVGFVVWCQVLVAVPCLLRTEVGSDSAALNTALNRLDTDLDQLNNLFGGAATCNATIVFTSDNAILRYGTGTVRSFSTR